MYGSGGARCDDRAPDKYKHNTLRAETQSCGWTVWLKWPFMKRLGPVSHTHTHTGTTADFYMNAHTHGLQRSACVWVMACMVSGAWSSQSELHLSASDSPAHGHGPQMLTQTHGYINIYTPPAEHTQARLYHWLIWSIMQHDEWTCYSVFCTMCKNCFLLIHLNE